jgi:hypothetical protein
MARDPKPQPKTAPKAARFNDVKFVNWSLSAEEKAACKAWLVTTEDYDNAISSVIEAAYKVTVSWDGYRSCYTASIVPTSDARGNQGYILTGKGSTSLKAVKQALYIHYHIMGEDWAAYSTATNAEELDD